MNRVALAAEILNYEVIDARRRCDAEPGNTLLAGRLARVQILASMVETFGLRSDISSGYVSGPAASAAELDDRSGNGNELAELARCVAVAGACASERGRLEADDLSGRCKQLSLPLDT